MKLELIFPILIILTGASAKAQQCKLFVTTELLPTITPFS